MQGGAVGALGRCWAVHGSAEWCRVVQRGCARGRCREEKGGAGGSRGRLTGGAGSARRRRLRLQLHPQQAEMQDEGGGRGWSSEHHLGLHCPEQWLLWWIILGCATSRQGRGVRWRPLAHCVVSLLQCRDEGRAARLPHLRSLGVCRVPHQGVLRPLSRPQFLPNFGFWHLGAAKSASKLVI